MTEAILTKKIDEEYVHKTGECNARTIDSNSVSINLEIREYR